MINFTARQLDVKEKIELLAPLFGVDPVWAVAIAMMESSLGEHQKSPTGCRGVFQMSGIAMKDLLIEMEQRDDDLSDIACGIAFLRLLHKRHDSIEAATAKFCDPKDRDFYVPSVMKYMKILRSENT
jgi:membrane-bound lytic murein transglycosylase MltF